MRSSTLRFVRCITGALVFWAACQMASAHGVTTLKVRTGDELVAAVLAANNSGKPTVIQLAPGTYDLAQTFASEYGTSVLPPVTGTILILGRNADTTRLVAAFPSGRFATVLPTGNLLMRGVTLAGGSDICELEFCDERGGGAALNAGGILWFEDCVLTGNAAYEINGNFGFGGAILNRAGHLHIGNSTISDNVSILYGGGVAILGGTASIRASVIRSNFIHNGAAPHGAYLFGGGLHIGTAKVWITDSSISGNRAGSDHEPDALFGIGIYNAAGTVWITDTAVTENSSVGPSVAGAGGGIDNRGTMFITDSTVAENTNGTLGGGIYNSGKLTLNGVTLARNHSTGAIGGGILEVTFPPGCNIIYNRDACFSGGGGLWNESTGTVQMSNTVMALNTIGSSGLGPDCHGTLISKGHNALGVTTECTLQHAAGDRVGIDPLLGELIDDGEPGKAYLPLLTNSPLIDAGGSVFASCSPLDQLGHRRTDGNHNGKIECDIGAVEFRNH